MEWVMWLRDREETANDVYEVSVTSRAGVWMVTLDVDEEVAVGLASTITVPSITFTNSATTGMYWP